jgi:hypothetical protein
MKVIGVVGYARAGKDTFASIALDILKENGIKAKQYSFAGALKDEVKDFLQKNCGVDVYTQDTELKKDIRDFLVWYGTTFWRKRDPKRWIRGVDNQLKSDGNDVDIAIVSDVRYPNEGEWVHSWAGYLVHVAAFHREQFLGHESPPIKRVFLDAPNEQERLNDPIVKKMADYKLEWPIKGLGPQEAVSDAELRMEVRKALNACSWFTDALIR